MIVLDLDGIVYQQEYEIKLKGVKRVITVEFDAEQYEDMHTAIMDGDITKIRELINCDLKGPHLDNFMLRVCEDFENFTLGQILKTRLAIWQQGKA